jgi:predicted NUDIX family NTP pyrophosphohydrolase
MNAVSAGLLLYRLGAHGHEVLLAHPGGPFFARRDAGAWTIPKGAPLAGESLVDAARREFSEEIGLPAPEELFELGSVRQRSGKTVHAWAALATGPREFVVRSNAFELEWPRGSGRIQRFPEVDRAEFFPPKLAAEKILAAQRPFLDRLQAHLQP